VFCSNQLGNSRQMDLSGPGIDVKLKERKKGAPKVFVFSLEIITYHKVFGNMNIIVFGNKTFVKMLGVIIRGT